MAGGEKGGRRLQEDVASVCAVQADAVLSCGVKTGGLGRQARLTSDGNGTGTSPTRTGRLKPRANKRKEACEEKEGRDSRRADRIDGGWSSARGRVQLGAAESKRSEGERKRRAPAALCELKRWALGKGF